MQASLVFLPSGIFYIVEVNCFLMIANNPHLLLCSGSIWLQRSTCLILYDLYDEILFFLLKPFHTMYLFWPVSTNERHKSIRKGPCLHQWGGGIPLGASRHLSWSLACGHLHTAVIQFRKTRICYHWISSLFPVALEVEFPPHFRKKRSKKKNTLKGSRCKRKESSECRRMFVWIWRL